MWARPRSFLKSESAAAVHGGLLVAVERCEIRVVSRHGCRQKYDSSARGVEGRVLRRRPAYELPRRFRTAGPLKMGVYRK
jgi:hypothetical protein